MVSDIIGKLGGLSEADLVQLNSVVIHELKHRRKARALNARSQFSVGDQVGFGDPNARGKRSYKEGKLVRIKRTRAEVLVEHTTWTVPLNMLQEVSP